MNWIKTHWKEILIVLLLLFSLNKCTQSCNRSSKITKQELQIQQMNSTITQLRQDSTLMAVRYSDAQSSNDAYRGIATGNQNEMIKKIEELTAQNNSLISENNKLKQENNNLKKQLKEKKK